MKWNKVIRDANRADLHRMAILFGVPFCKPGDMDGDLEDRIWRAAERLKYVTGELSINVSTGKELEAICVAFDLDIHPAHNDDSVKLWLKQRLSEIKKDEQPATRKIHQHEWEEGLHFARANPSPDQTQPELYKVLHPGIHGGRMAFSFAIHSGEEMLVDKDGDWVGIAHPGELAERIQEAAFFRLLGDAIESNMPFNIILGAARQIFSKENNNE